MFIKKEAIDSVLLKMQENLKKTGIQIRPDVLERFENSLVEIANNGAYQEGTKIKEADLVKITNEAELVIHDIASVKGEIKAPVEQLMIATYYLYAVAMKKLGSPDIPLLFGTEMQNIVCKFATNISSRQTLVQGDYFAEDIYDAQRGKNADVVKAEVQVALDAARVAAATPSQVQHLVAEYQALAKRQNAHGFFWRLFHRAENAARVDLLSEMEQHLKTMLGEDVNLMKSTSLYLAEKTIEKNVAGQVKAAFANNGIEKRDSTFNKALTSPAKQIDIKMFLNTGYRPDLESIEHEWNIIKPLYDAVQKGELFGEKNVANNTVKEILSKNYIRIQLFKAKVDKDGVESARGLLDQMESIYAHEDVQFNKVNPDYAVPEIPVGAEKEKIEVNLDEPVADKSEKLDAPVKSAIEKNLV